VFFFTACALAIWVIYASLQTGVPARPALNVERLAPGYVPQFSAVALVFAIAATVAWLWLVRWRTGRHRHPLWKSLVLPASGVALCWLLLMTLWLPLLDHARSYRPLIQRIAKLVPREGCVAAAGVPRPEVVALEYHGGYRVDALADPDSTACGHMVQMETRARPGSASPRWERVGVARRPTDKQEVTAVYRRAPGTP
jgi:4-amino-4-deoxy-L-arabinose transferase-like glycosyltransferase